MATLLLWLLESRQIKTDQSSWERLQIAQKHRATLSLITYSAMADQTR